MSQDTEAVVCFLLPVKSQPRFLKRIAALEELGMRGRILAFERNYFTGEADALPYISLGSINNGAYLRRVPRLLSAVAQVRRSGKTAHAIYAFGLDMLLVGWLATRFLRQKPMLVYEVGDVREALTANNGLARVLRWLERRLVRRSALVVVTSDAFVREYFHRIQGLTEGRYHVIENKLPSNFPRPHPQLPVESRGRSVLTIGYFGLLRCVQSWEILKSAVVRGGGRIRVVARGFPLPPSSIPEDASNIPGIEYLGTYKAPSDLPSLYAGVDLVWACAPYRGNLDGNSRWARANRFYEAVFFGKPLITQAGNEDGRIVELEEFGMSIDLSDLDSAVKQLLSITHEQLELWTSRVRNAPSEMVRYTDEHERLLELLRGVK